MGWAEDRGARGVACKRNPAIDERQMTAVKEWTGVELSEKGRAWRKAKGEGPFQGRRW